VAFQWVATGLGGPEVLEMRPVELAPPGPGEVAVEVRAAGMNPVDYKHFRRGGDPSVLPLPIGDEISGVVTAIGPDTQLASGGGVVGDEVIAFRIKGGYATHLVANASNVFAKPPNLGFPEAANLLLVATTASEMLHVVKARQGETVLLHGAAGAVGVDVLQQAQRLGVTVIGTADAKNFDHVIGYGGVPVRYGPGLEDRVRALAPNGVVAALDAVGSTEAIDVSEDLVADRARIVTIANPERAASDGLHWIVSAIPASTKYRDSVRGQLIGWAGQGLLEVPIAATYPLEQAREAIRALMGDHPYGKLALVA
jgi:NADPH:quinone reductase